MLSPSEELSLVIARTSGVLLTGDVVGVLLPMLLELVLETVPGADSCAVTVVDGAGRPATTAASDAVAARADAVQYTAGEGPCLAAVTRRARSVVHDTREETRWPLWAGDVAALGVRSVLSVPLVAGDEVLGAVKVYGRAPHAFDLRSERVLALTAAQAALLLAEARAADRGRHLSAGLKAALRHRDVVNTARGVLIGRDHVDEETAVEVLAALAQREGRPLHVVARSLVDAATRRRP
nr:GAF and ANTAR domain-containing protein [Kineococcus aurantiacus]